LRTGAAEVEPGRVGRAVEVQLKPSVTVRLQPSVFSGRGRLIVGGGGYIWAPMPTHKDTTNPDTRPDRAPWKTMQTDSGGNERLIYPITSLSFGILA